MKLLELTRDRDALTWRLWGMIYVRVGRVVSFDAGRFAYRRIGRTWLISWRWKP